jgi:hypothetical protein
MVWVISTDGDARLSDQERLGGKPFLTIFLIEAVMGFEWNTCAKFGEIILALLSHGITISETPDVGT